ncbi:MAG: mucoidy inhibitor MuiA family protein [Verrucomicrobia bacterium]|nr:mucoidy inhibitor MuiA family protein [Verrucomicrobiota bacterium]
MKIFSCLCFAAALGAAEVKTPDAKPREVTVYADRAEVVRIFKGDLAAGDQSLLFDDLPANVDFASIRVEGTGAFTLIDIRPETVQVKEVANEAIRALQAKIQAQELVQKELALAEGRVAFRRSALDKVLGRLTSVGKESANPEMDPLKWAAYLDFQAEQQVALDKEATDLAKRVKESRQLVDTYNREISALNGNQSRSRNLAHVNLEVKAAGPAEVRLSYVVHGPSWKPVYDLRADTKVKTLEITYHAELRQSTGEDWQGVSLKLSTAEPSVGGREPEMSPWFLSKAEPVALEELRKDSDGLNRRSLVVAGRIAGEKQNFVAANGGNGFQANEFGTKAEAKLADATVSTAAVVAGGTAATYVIERTTDIKSDNKLAKVTVMRLLLPSTYRHSCVPKLSSYVYLKTHATNKSDFTLLPGRTSVFLDGAFVANASMDLVPAGQEFWTFLGVDQSVSVERKELARREESSGLFGKKTLRTVFDQVFKVKNGKATEIDLVIWDQLPMGDHEDIKVVLEEPKYEKDSESFKMNESKYVEWRHAVKAGEKRDVPYRFAIERPEDMQVLGY